MTEAGNFLAGLRPESRLLLRTLLRDGPLSKGELSQRTGIKLSTLNRLMEPLEAQGLAGERAVGESSGGRRPGLFGVCPERYCLVGVEISRIRICAVLADLEMRALDRRQWTMTGESTPLRVAGDVKEWLEDALGRHAMDRDRVIGAGAGVVGRPRPGDGTLGVSENYPARGWEGVALRELLERRLGVPVTVDSGAAMAALAEGTRGAARGRGSVFYVNCGVGIRLGALTGGDPARVVSRREDALEHMTVDWDGLACACGGRGCVGTLATIPAITARFAGTRQGSHGESVPWPEISRAAGRGAPLAAAVVTEAGAALGAGLSNAIGLLGPGTVILDGPLAEQSPLYRDACVRTTLEKLGREEPCPVRFEKGAFGELSMAVGAAAWRLEEALGADPRGENHE